MKDVELVAHMLLLLELGPRGYSSSELDAAFSERDAEWEERVHVEKRFRSAVDLLCRMSESPAGDALLRSRMRNQADFYSLFGALDRLLCEGVELDAPVLAERAATFAVDADSEDKRAGSHQLRDYYDAARSASNDAKPRQTRINLLESVLRGIGIEDDPK